MSDKIDQTIKEANEVKRMIQHSVGFKILQKRWENIKQQAFNDLINENFDDITIKARQVLYNQICEWIEIPRLIVKDGEDILRAKEEEEEEEKGMYDDDR